MAKKNEHDKGRKKAAIVTTATVDMNEVLSQSRIAFEDGAFAKALEVIRTASPLTASNKESVHPAVAQIGAWSAYKVGKFAEADEFLNVLSSSVRLGVSETILRSLLHFEFREFPECIRTAEPILMPLSDSARVSEKELLSKAQLDLISCLAMSYYNISEFASAANVLEEAIRARDDYAPFYINLAKIRERMNDQQGMRKAISEGLVRCGDKGDLAKLANEFVGTESISLCMIVKNEEAMLDQCLSSVKGLVGEIIVVDTGSTDKTVSIAEKHGAKVYHHPWQDDFSFHRNQSIDYATGDWILILDADEEFQREDLDKIKQATRIPDINVISISVHNKHLRTGEVTSFLPSVRMWRRKLNARYEGIVHNELRLPEKEPILRVDAKITHYGYGLDWEQMKKKIARSKALLHKQLKENPNNFFANFNLAQILRGEHKLPPPEVCREIIEHAGRAVRYASPTLPGQRHIHLMALDQIVSAYFYLGEYRNAEQTALRALELDPNYLDPMFQLGHVYAGARDFQKAIPAYEKYIAAADQYNSGTETTSYILIHSQDQASALFALGLIHEELQLDDRAETYFKRIFDYKPDHGDVKTHLAMIRYRKGDFESAREYATARVVTERNDITAHYLLAQIEYGQKRVLAARKHCLDILGIDPTHTRALELIIEIERQANNTGEAMRRIDQLLASNPTHRGALDHKAEVFLGQGQMDRALELYLHLRETNSRDAELLNNIGNCHFKKGDFPEAIRSYSEALSIKPQLVPALRNIGIAHFKAGDNAKAADKLALYLDHIRDDFDVTYLLARLYFDLQDYSLALRYAELCVTAYPRSAELIAFLSDCYLRLGHLDSARVGYAKALEVDPAFAPARTMLQEIDKATQKQAVKG